MFIIKLKARKFSIPLIVLCIFIGLDAQTKNERLIEKKQRLQELLGLGPDGSLKEEAFEILSQNLGSLGIEAMSRGASRVVFVEKNWRVFKVLRKNIELFKKHQCDLFLSDAVHFLTLHKNLYFDIIFADPPYTDVSLQSIKEKVKKNLKPGGIFCMEMKKEPIDESNIRVKHYGSTQIVFWRTAA